MLYPAPLKGGGVIRRSGRIGAGWRAAIWQAIVHNVTYVTACTFKNHNDYRLCEANT